MGIKILKVLVAILGVIFMFFFAFVIVALMISIISTTQINGIGTFIMTAVGSVLILGMIVGVAFLWPE